MKLTKFLITHPGMGLGILICFVFIFFALFASVLAPLVPNPISPSQLLPEGIRYVPGIQEAVPQPPTKGSPLGTVPVFLSGGLFHQDVFYATVWGCRSALRFGLIVAFGAAVLGTIIGAISGYIGGLAEWLLMRTTDGFLTFPLIAGVILISDLQFILLYPSGLPGFDTEISIPMRLSPIFDILFSLEFVLVLFTWMPYARLLNALVRQLKTSQFVEAARVIGVKNSRIILRHLIPNCLSPVIVLISRDIGAVVLLQTTLSFVGFFGGSIWGDLLLKSRDYVIGLHGNPFLYWWVWVPICLTIVLFGMGWGLLGDGLNDLFNPRRRTA